MTDDDLDRHIRAIIAREGGWVDDPDDSGGPTNYGITLAMWASYRGLSPGMAGRETQEELRALVENDPRVWTFYRWYFRTQGLAELIDEFEVPEELVPLVMDMRTLHSPEGCRKILRRALDRNGYAHFSQWVSDENAQAAGDAIAFSRMRYMLEVANERRKDKKYVEGWMRRALKAVGWWPPRPETMDV